MTRKTPYEVRKILAEFGLWLEKTSKRTPGGIIEQQKHAQIILNDIYEYKWDISNYINCKEKKGKDNGQLYKDSTIIALKGTHSLLLEFFSNPEVRSTLSDLPKVLQNLLFDHIF